MFIYSVKDDECRVSGDLKLGVGYRRSMVDHHHDVFRLGTHCSHVHGPAGVNVQIHTNMHSQIRRWSGKKYGPQLEIMST